MMVHEAIAGFCARHDISTDVHKQAYSAWVVVQGYIGESLQQDIVNVLTDLRHLCDEEDMDFLELLDKAVAKYKLDCLVIDDEQTTF